MPELPKQYAVIKLSGHQYRVAPGQTIEVNRFDADGKTAEFSEVLLVSDNGKVTVGRPNVEKATVTGDVVYDGKAKKVIVQKFKSKVRYRKKQGHRQSVMRIKITGIKTGA
jgi:large subunit ribosomal protein L21